MVKKLIVFIVTALAAVGAAQATYTVGCDDMAGYWSDEVTPHASTYNCTQNASKTFTCSVSLFNGGTSQYCNVSYSGAFNTANGFLEYAETYVSGTCPSPSPWSGSTNQMSVSTHCAQMVDLALNNTVYGNNYVRTKNTDGSTGNPACETPGTKLQDGTFAFGENESLFYGWLTGTPFYAAQFTATLRDNTDQNFNFSGRITREVITGGTGCGGTRVNQVNSSWRPDVANNYSVGWDSSGFQPDDIGDGWPEVIVIQRDYGITLPCTIVYHQQMLIDCTVDAQYENHDINHIIGDGTITEKRNISNGQSATEPAGLTRQVWRWMDWYPDLLMPPFFPPN